MTYQLDERQTIMVDGVYLDGTSSTALDVAYRNAAVEFWQEIERLTAQRDELLAAAKRADATLDFPPYYPEKETTRQLLKAAIARVEAEQRGINTKE